MLIKQGDLFKPSKEVDAICIPTNGQRKQNGRAVMGAGVAKIARDKWPELDIKLGWSLHHIGNRVHIFTVGDLDILFCVVSFPTKNHWRNPSNVAILNRSAHQLVELADQANWNQVWLPVVGCGLGGLSWTDEVAPLLSSILDDRFVIIVR